jgi:AcrR family transcriptional regulator
MARTGVGRTRQSAPRSPVGSGTRPRTARGERTRRRLLDAAERVFAERGYHDASIVKITEAAEVGQGTFYLYFKSKQEIFEELVDDLNRRVRHAMTAAVDGESRRIDIERAGLMGFLRFTAEHPALYSIIRQSDLVAPASTRRHYEAIARPYAEGLRHAMQRGEIAEGDSEVLAYILMGIGEMVGRRWVLGSKDRRAPDAVLEQTFRFIDAGLQARR